MVFRKKSPPGFENKFVVSFPPSLTFLGIGICAAAWICFPITANSAQSTNINMVVFR
jgi:hypothetical protein